MLSVLYLITPLGVTLLVPDVASADAPQLENSGHASNSEQDAAEAGTTRPSTGKPTSKQYDPRLPAVLPGETVVTESGDRMRVWTSAGPVPLNTPPVGQNSGIGGVNLLLDQRLLDRRDPNAPLRPR